MLSAMYSPDDIGYMNNSLQKQFALDGLHDKIFYLGLDIDEHFQLDQATFQSMVCGEEVSVIRKFKSPITVKWAPNGGFAGNKLPNWSDNGGSLQRRLIIIEFMRVVTDVDPNLLDKCFEYKDRFIKVISAAYMDTVRKFGTQSIKNKMPKRFKVAQERSLKELNTLWSFICDGCETDNQDDVHNETRLTTSFAEFVSAFRVYCQNNNIRQQTMVYNYYNSVFAKMNIRVVDKPDKDDEYGHTLKYIIGLRLK